MFLIKGPIDKETYSLRSISKFEITVSPISCARTDVRGRIDGYATKQGYRSSAKLRKKGSNGILISDHRVISAKEYLSLPCLPNGDLSPNINISKYPTLKEVMDAERNRSN